MTSFRPTQFQPLQFQPLTISTYCIFNFPQFQPKLILANNFTELRVIKQN